MARMQNPNIEILETAVAQLGPLADEMVFLGGCATGLLITDVAAPPIRATRDVDAIVQVGSRAEYYRLAEKLREAGFREDSSEGAPLCRWVADEVILDVMPTDAQILGFGNAWYRAAIKHATEVQLPSGRKIQMVSAPYFLATKLEAFSGRGRDDYLLSHDIEDFVAVLDGRPEVAQEVEQADEDLQQELSASFSTLLKTNRFTDAIHGHLPGDATSQARVAIVLERMKQIAKAK